MTTRMLVLCISTACLLLAAAAASAHHSFAAQFDATKRVTLTGAVTKVDWMNPHIYFYVDVPDEESGELVNWAFEMGSPNTLIRLGWTRSSLQEGDQVTVQGSMARDGSRLVNASSVVMTETGRRMFAGSSEPEGR